MEKTKLILKSNKQVSNNIILYNKIKRILVNEIKKYDKNYIYISISDLKNKCVKYLNQKLKTYAIFTYIIMTSPYKNDSYNHNMLLEISNDLELLINKRAKTIK